MTIVDKAKVFKLFRNNLRKDNPLPNLVLGLKSGLFDFFVSSFKEDKFYTLVFDFEKKNIEGLRDAIRRHQNLSSKILTKKFYIVYINRDLDFKYIEVKN